MDALNKSERFYLGNCSMRCSTTDIPVGVSLILAGLNQRFLKIGQVRVRKFLLVLLCLSLGGCYEFRALAAMNRSADSFLPLPGDSRVRVEPGAESNAHIAASALNSAIARVEKAQGRFIKPVVVYVAASIDSYARYCVSRKSGACVINQRLFISPKPENTATRIPRILTHELSHLQMEQHLGVWKWLSDAPVWFQEGLAVWVSDGSGAEGVTPEQAEQAILAGKGFVPNAKAGLLFRKTAQSFGLTPHMFYRQAGLFVQWLHGANPGCFEAMLRKVQAGTPVDDALKTACGAGVTENWRNYVALLRKKARAQVDGARP